jgi:hypothetical protein
MSCCAASSRISAMIDLTANRPARGRKGNYKQPAFRPRVKAVWVLRVKRQAADPRQAGVHRAPGLSSIRAPEYPGGGPQVHGIAFSWIDRYPDRVTASRHSKVERESSERSLAGFYSGSPTSLRMAFTRGSSRTESSSGTARARPSRTGPCGTIFSRAAAARCLSPRPASAMA